MFNVDTSELDKLARDLAKAGDEKHREARRATQVVGRRAKTQARATVARDTGGTAQSGIRMKTWTQRDGSHTDVFTTRDERGVNVGFLLEYGTADMAPRPFLAIQRPTREAELVRALAEIADPFVIGPTDEIGDD
jgi:hypothetical protein